MKESRFNPHRKRFPCVVAGLRPSGQKLAMSLIELLVVMSVITVFVGGAAFMWSGRASGLFADVSRVCAALSEARELALSSNVRTRFAIFTDTSGNPEAWRLRRFAILREVRSEEDGAPGGFVLASSPENLSRGIGFQPADKYGAGVFAATSRANANLPGATDAEYAYVEFLPSGEASKSAAASIFQLGRDVKTEAQFASEDWAAISVSRLTGRVRVERKETP